MNTKIISTFLSVGFFFGASIGQARIEIRKASAHISVTKTTMTKVNGHYQSKQEEICSQQVSFPVFDNRVPDQEKHDDFIFKCDSTIKNVPVTVQTLLFLQLERSTFVPWKMGKETDVKLFGAYSYIDRALGSVDPNKVQPVVLANSFSEDLTVKEMGFVLAPGVEWSSTCSVSSGDPTPCTPNETVNFEEYFTTVLYIEDKAQ